MNEKQMNDIFGHWHVPFWQTDWFISLLWLALSLVALIVIFFIIKKITTKKISPLAQALKDIFELQKQTITSDNAQQLYLQLTHILKTFFQAHFAAPYTALTDQQMVDAYVQKNPHDPKMNDSLQEIAHAGTLIKFARQDALDDQFKKHLNFARALLQHTSQGKNRENE